MSWIRDLSEISFLMLKMPEVTSRSIVISLCHLLFMAGVIWLCFHFAGSYESAGVNTIRFEPLAIAVVVICSVGLAWLSIRLWLSYLDVFIQHRIQVRLALIGVGASLVAKYLPGKVWGVVAKTFLYKRERLDARQVFASSVLEIYGSVAFAAAVGSVFYLAAVLRSEVLGTMLVAVLAVVVSGLVFAFPPALHWAGVERYLRLSVPKATWRFPRIAAMVGWNWAYWACFAVIMVVLWQGSADVGYGRLLGVVGAYLVSVTAGFLVILIPGGVGVREGVFVFLAQQLIDLQVALQLAAMMRLWACAYDLVFGAVSYFVYLQLRSGK